MNQWDIAAQIYEKVCELAAEKSSDSCSIAVSVADMCQVMSDKGGQRIVINELMYEQPAMFEMVLSIEFSGKTAAEMLKKYCETAVFLKDNPAITIDEAYRWHGMNGNSVYIEPVIRKPSADKERSGASENNGVLLYRVEFSLNSQKPEEFKRVEKQVIRGFLK